MREMDVWLVLANVVLGRVKVLAVPNLTLPLCVK